MEQNIDSWFHFRVSKTQVCTQYEIRHHALLAGQLSPTASLHQNPQGRWAPPEAQEMSPDYANQMILISLIRHASDWSRVSM